MNKKTFVVIKSIIKDLSTDDLGFLFEAQTLLYSPHMTALLLDAGCPQNLINAMQEASELSPVERRYCCKKILKELRRLT